MVCAPTTQMPPSLKVLRTRHAVDANTCRSRFRRLIRRRKQSERRKNRPVGYIVAAPTVSQSDNFVKAKDSETSQFRVRDCDHLARSFIPGTVFPVLKV